MKEICPPALFLSICHFKVLPPPGALRQTIQQREKRTEQRQDMFATFLLFLP